MTQSLTKTLFSESKVGSSSAIVEESKLNHQDDERIPDLEVCEVEERIQCQDKQQQQQQQQKKQQQPQEINVLLSTSKSIYFFYLKYISSWIRMPSLLVIVMYIFLISGNIATYRNQHTQYFDERTWTPGKYNLTSTDRIHMTLPDFVFDIYHTNSVTVTRLVDLLPFISVILMIVSLLYRHNILLIAEAFWIEIIVLGCMSITHTITTLPDPYGLQSACHDPTFKEWGPWIFLRVSPVFCGDCIWSGHTYHLFFCLYIIYRGFKGHSPCPTLLSDIKYKILYWIVSIILLITLIVSILFIRLHYGVDVFLAILVPSLVIFNRVLINWGVRFLYPPASKLSDEQINNLNDS